MSDLLASSGRATKPLTAKELRTIQGYAVGLRACEIAELYGVAESTIHDQTEWARRKLGAKTTEHAVALAIRQGLL